MSPAPVSPPWRAGRGQGQGAGGWVVFWGVSPAEDYSCPGRIRAQPWCWPGSMVHSRCLFFGVLVVDSGVPGGPSTGCPVGYWEPLGRTLHPPFPALSPSHSPQPLLCWLLRAPSQQRGLIKGSLDLGAPAPRHPPCLSLGKIKWEGVGEGSPDAWVPCVRLGREGSSQVLTLMAVGYGTPDLA